MNLMAMVLAGALLLSAVPAAAADAGSDAGHAAQQLLQHFREAWRAGDARNLAALFAADADFVSPYGNAARGRDAIEAFYAGAFARGYAGSDGSGDMIDVRVVGPDLALLDARWRIDGARNPDGSPRAPEKGILFAVLAKRDGTWQILALRENAGASELVPLTAGTR